MWFNYCKAEGLNSKRKEYCHLLSDLERFLMPNLTQSESLVLISHCKSALSYVNWSKFRSMQVQNLSVEFCVWAVEDPLLYGAKKCISYSHRKWRLISKMLSSNSGVHCLSISNANMSVKLPTCWLGPKPWFWSQKTRDQSKMYMVDIQASL